MLKCSLFLSLLLSLSTSVLGVSIPFKGTAVTYGISKNIGARGILSPTGNIKNVQDIRYTANIALNGKDVVVALDTGSSDLWQVFSSSSSPTRTKTEERVYYPPGLETVNDTGINGSLRYGDGSSGVNGIIALASLEFGTYNVTAQGITELGINGVLGLGFPQVSDISATIHANYGADATWGQPFLTNVFQNAPIPNFIAIRLGRTENLEDTSGGSFDIAEYDLRYSSVQNAPELAVYSQGYQSWQTLLDGIRVNKTRIPIMSNQLTVPSSKAIAVLDTGASVSTFTRDVVKAIYSKVSGAVNDAYKYGYGWILPCNATIDVEFSFGGQNFSVHPLDLSTPTQLMVQKKNYTACLGSFVAVDVSSSSAYDYLLGDPFLRNTYTVYNFGNSQKTTPRPNLSEPYMQLLSLTNALEAAAETVAARQKTLSNMAPELAPADLLNLIKQERGGGPRAM
ncbi:Aspartic peptidase domain containing protein [Amanita muscaria]